jgi:hypothetical protein
VVSNGKKNEEEGILNLRRDQSAFKEKKEEGGKSSSGYLNACVVVSVFLSVSERVF